ncbi:MAG: hypothetical protein WAN50_05190 [Minisyncoccia bacterium]
MKLDINSIVLVVITLVIAAGAYWYFFLQTGNQPPLTTTTTDTGAQDQFKSLVGELQSIKFDTSIFSDPRFTSLTDLATPIAPEASGRTDPFAPFPGQAMKSQTGN